MGRLTVTVRDLLLLQGSSPLDPLSKSLVQLALVGEGLGQAGGLSDTQKLFFSFLFWYM